MLLAYLTDTALRYVESFPTFQILTVDCKGLSTETIKRLSTFSSF